MSKSGIKKFASILSTMQTARNELLQGDNQDIRLGQLLDDAKEAVKDRFCKITLERDTKDGASGKIVHKGDRRFRGMACTVFACWDAVHRIRNPLVSPSWKNVTCPKCRRRKFGNSNPDGKILREKI